MVLSRLCRISPQAFMCRWTMTLKSRFLPWQPKLVFSGFSYYTVDAVYGKITGQRDVWDALQDNSSPSVRDMFDQASLCKASNLASSGT